MAAGSLREKAVIGTLVVVAMYALAAGLWFMRFRHGWSEAADRFAKTEKRIAHEERTIAEKGKWDKAYEDEVLQIRELDENQNPDTFLYGLVQDIATRNHITISSQKTSREGVADEMKKMKVDIEWVGALETLVKFLYELETTDEGKFDVESMNFNPYAKRPGFLTGKMTLTCIYRRKE